MALYLSSCCLINDCVKKFIDAVDNKKPLPNLSILDAMAILTEAWGRVSEETIRKCFRKAGIGNQAQQSALNDDEDVIDIAGAPNVNFRKISVRKTMWDLEFSEHLL